MRLTTAIVAFLMVLSSSGFTVVLHSCLMAERSCCSASMTGHMAGDEGAIPGKPELKNDMSCCSTTVAGGVNSNPIVTGTLQPALAHLDLVALLPPMVSSGGQCIASHSTFFLSSTAASPPSVEKYVLNSSFLI